MNTIGFIGIGVMGNSMAGHVLKAGFKLNVFNRTKEKAARLVQEGASWFDDAGSLARQSEIIITMVGYPFDVEKIYFGPDGIIENALPGTMLIDMTTSSPELAVRIASAAEKKNLLCLDAPVSGGDTGAKNASLTIMCGGTQTAFDIALPLLQTMGKTIILQGPAGSGQHSKMANQIAIAGSLCGVCESMLYAKNSGLDPLRVLESISFGSAGSWQLINLAPKMIKEDFNPGFYIKHFLKDLRIALNASKAANIKLPVTEMAEKFFSILSEQGKSELGTQALFLLYLDSDRYNK